MEGWGDGSLDFSQFPVSHFFLFNPWYLNNKGVIWKLSHEMRRDQKIKSWKWNINVNQLWVPVETRSQVIWLIKTGLLFPYQDSWGHRLTRAGNESHNIMWSTSRHTHANTLLKRNGVWGVRHSSCPLWSRGTMEEPNRGWRQHLPHPLFTPGPLPSTNSSTLSPPPPSSHRTWLECLQWPLLRHSFRHSAASSAYGLTCCF